jgi:hypothetical protein
MTKQDFELIAAALKAARPGEQLQDPMFALIDISLDRLINDFAERLKATNKQFNRDKFIRAAGGRP